MNTKDIPKGWWLNVTVMARYQDSFIVGVLRKGKASWITEDTKGQFNTAEEAYEWGMKTIEAYQLKKSKQQSLDLVVEDVSSTISNPGWIKKSTYRLGGEWTHTIVSTIEDVQEVLTHCGAMSSDISNIGVGDINPALFDGGSKMDNGEWVEDSSWSASSYGWTKDVHKKEDMITGKDIDHLMWIHDRLIEVHKESRNTDYLIKMREIIEKIKS